MLWKSFFRPLFTATLNSATSAFVNHMTNLLNAVAVLRESLQRRPVHGSENIRQLSTEVHNLIPVSLSK